MKHSYRLLFLFLFPLTTLAQDAFITTWKTDNFGGSADNQITIPTFPEASYDYSVDWGDGTQDTGVTGDITHTYAAPGTYQVSITGSFPRIYFYINEDNQNDSDKLLTIDQWGTQVWTSMNFAFSGCENLDVVATDTPDLSGLTDISNMFSYCTNLVGNASFNSWDTSSVTDMFALFFECVSFNQPIGNWNMSSVQEASGIFAGAELFNQDISNWDMSNVTGLNGLFNSAKAFNQDISGWDVSNVRAFNATFAFTDVFNQDISGWNVSSGIVFDAMFEGAQAFNQDISGWDVSGAIGMTQMFKNAAVFNQDLGSWDVSRVRRMAAMFMDAPAFNQDLSGWNVSDVETMNSMFEGATAFDQPLGNWTLNSITTLERMFTNAGLSTGNYDATLTGWEGFSGLPSDLVFDGGNSMYCASYLERAKLKYEKGWIIRDGGLDAGACPERAFITTWRTDNSGGTADNQITIPTAPGETYDYTVDWGDGSTDTGVTGNITHTYATPGSYKIQITGQFPRISFEGATGQNDSPLDNHKLLTIEQWGSQPWTSMELAFLNCSVMQVTALDVPILENLTSIESMFIGCNSMVGAPSFGGWEIDGLTSIRGLFEDCHQFNSDISRWDVSGVEDFSFAFSSAFRFNADISGWDTSAATNMRATFQDASDFNQDLSSWNVDQVTDMLNMFFGASSFNQDIGAWNTGLVQNMNSMFANASSFNQDIGNWNVGQVTDMAFMFFNAAAFDQNIGNWNVTVVSDLTSMFEGAELSTANYDNLLTGWSAQTVNNGLDFHAGTSSFCSAYKSRQALIDTYGWNITDSGIARECAFITTWKTDNPGVSEDNQITIPTFGGESYDYVVEWGDGTSDFGVGGSITHTYVAPGTYQVTIYGDFPRIYFNDGAFSPSVPGDPEKIIAIDNWGSIEWSSMAGAFTGCKNMDVTATDVPNLSATTDLTAMFRSCESLTGNGSFNLWNVSGVSQMGSMFQDCSLFNQDIGNWNTGNVNYLSFMFFGASAFNQDISGWNTSNAQYMSSMFASARAFNQEIGNWNVSNVLEFQAMFAGAESFNQDIGSWDLSSATRTDAMFSGAIAFNQNIGRWNVSNVTTFNTMFFNTQAFDQNLGAWDISSVSDMRTMFLDAGLSRENYDETLIGWASLPTLQSGVEFDAGISEYCEGADARQFIIDTYGWTILDQGEIVGCRTDGDEDGILDYLDLCPATPQGTAVTSNGCDFIPQDAFEVYVLTPSCLDSNDGQIAITMDAAGYLLDLDLTGPSVSRSEIDQPSGTTFRFQNLTPGEYNVTISIPEILLERRFGITVNELGAISGRFVRQNKNSGTLTYEVSGSRKYDVIVNGFSREFNFQDTAPNQITLDNISGPADVQIRGVSECQGVFSELRYLGEELLVFPTFTLGEVHVLSADEPYELQVFAADGRLLKTEKFTGSTNSIDLSSFGSGLYLLSLRKGAERETIKIIKQ